jgi:hypothetical protein
MGNHFHLLLEVPRHDTSALAEMSDEQLLDRLGHICSGPALQKVRVELEARRAQGEDVYRAYRRTFERRMCDLPVFMRELKQRYSQWFNRRSDRQGPLWEDRYKSVLLEGDTRVGGTTRTRTDVGALLTIAAYIDLNPVRAGIVRDPKDYRWCGYSEALGGSQDFRAGVARLVGRTVGKPTRSGELPALKGENWKEVVSRYRLLLYEHGGRPGTAAKGRRAVVDQKVIERERECGGALPLSAILRCKVRYFTDGLALGRSEFLEQVFEGYRERLGLVRGVGARIPRGVDLGQLRVMRDLRGEVTG